MSGFMSKVTAFFAELSLIIVYLFGFGTVGVSDGYEITGHKKLILANALYIGQGICTDGDYYYSSGSLAAINVTALAKWDKKMHRVKSNFIAVPKNFTKDYKSNHIGGIDCYDGKIYCPVEGDGYERNFILVYDCDTLKYTGEFYEMTCDRLNDGIPWCAVDGDNGYLYTSRYSDVTEILQYRLSDMKFIKAIKLDKTVTRIQGGSVYKGKLYLSTDVSNSTVENVFAVTLSNGHTALEMTRTMSNYDNEAEDICVFPFDDGSLIHIIDYDKLVGTNIYHYSKTK